MFYRTLPDFIVNDCEVCEKVALTSIADDKPLNIFGVDVIDQLSPEVLSELLVWNTQEEGALENRGDVVCDFFALFHIFRYKNKGNFLPVSNL